MWPQREAASTVRRCGLDAVPQMALNVSGSMSSCGTLVRTKGTAPAARATATSTPSASLGSKVRQASPHVESQPFMLTWMGGGEPL